MILSKAGRLSLLAGFGLLLLMGFAGTSYAAGVRFDVYPSPTEVIVTGRSEVLGSINMIVDTLGGPNFVTGTSAGGPAQIGVIYGNGVQIDNLDIRGIRVFWSTNFNAIGGGSVITLVQQTNSTANGRCSGFISINVPAGLSVATGDFIRLEGVRGRIDLSDGGVGPGVDLYASLQSINDPAAYNFVPDSVRIAHTLDPIEVAVTPATVLLCFPTTGVASAGTLYPTVSATNLTTYNIQVRERFQRAFVAADSGPAGADATDRTNSRNGTVPTVFPTGAVFEILGAPTNSTQLTFVLNSIPKSVASISWPATFYNDQSPTQAVPQPPAVPPPAAPYSFLTLVPASTSFTAASSNTSNDGKAFATYSYGTTNQVGFSDITIESFYVNPLIVLSTTNQQVTGTVLAAATLAPAAAAEASSCAPPATSGTSTIQPRFVTKWVSGASFLSQYTSFNSSDTNFSLYATIARCTCYLLYPFVTKVLPVGASPGWTTGIAVANTTMDTQVFGAIGAPQQQGLINFFWYDKALGYVGTTTTTALVASGNSFVADISQMLPTGVTAFTGYMIAAAQFQYCHGYAFISDPGYQLLAQGYVAGVIPDPAIKAGSRQPSAAADFTNGGKGVPAGESLNF